ncbi:hypothetical protein CDG77_31960 [Nostoc sp. 'Peltigera membranacea cyanobiont' 213]|uniref:DUF1877 family protein n=1 Tax=Nostoc sp. 'Peltigera membranacea cyanobiont' 213 TaxID=2014530 RepID=UPI000B957E8A|nr:DUF1877 family protein [Nostoc sp. 'Peltigera membranacea cyanobiont' 213]OYD86980.1 hypothetical protein CDG77_31960 [Nostoc sp. 'Peltigera membranacea cyanobiont' 213]
MGIVGELKQISPVMLDKFKINSSFLDIFFSAKYLAESPFWEEAIYISGNSRLNIQQQSEDKFKEFKWTDNQQIKNTRAEFLKEWQISELSLGKSWHELHFLLTGYTHTDKLSFLVSKNSSNNLPKISLNNWSFFKIFNPILGNKKYIEQYISPRLDIDNLPLVNAILGGTEIGNKEGYGKHRYLIPDEVRQVAEALSELSENGFITRYKREEVKEEQVGIIDWSEPETVEWLTEYYKGITAYYIAANNLGNAMLLYLT